MIAKILLALDESARATTTVSTVGPRARVRPRLVLHLQRW